MKNDSEKCTIYPRAMSKLSVFRFPPFISRTGFSYAEFLIVITLTIILALGTTASLFHFTRDQAAQSAARAIRAVLRDAEQRSIAQEENMYWGVRFENVPGPRDRYMLIKSPTNNPLSYAISDVAYLSPSAQLGEPVADTTIMFDKITGDMLSAVCPSAKASTIISINTVSIRVYCNGKIE